MSARRVATLGVVLLAACGGERTAVPIPTMTAAAAPFAIAVSARGELRAVKSTPIQVPPVLQWSQTIAWLAPDGGAVKAGEVVARLDATQMRLTEDSARREVDKVGLAIGAQRAEHAQQRLELRDQLEMLREETEVARHYAPKDETVFSRHEIIEAQVNLDVLLKKAGLYEEKRGRQQRKQAADAQLLELQRNTHSVKLRQVEEGLKSLELLAPHDGLFLHGRNWRGDRVMVGTSVWRGQQIGELPDLSSMEAKVQVLESEAAGIAVGERAEVVLDAVPGTPFPGKVKTVEAVAQARDEGSPVKYFDVVLELDRTDTRVMKPGQQLRATIFVAREAAAVSVPNQALFHRNDETWVIVRAHGAWQRRTVALGPRSLTRTVVTKGLAAGEVVALADPGVPDAAPPAAGKD